MLDQPSLKNLILIMFIVLAYQATLTNITDLTYTQLDEFCKKAPLWKLNMCNQTCSTCSTSNSNACASCPRGFDFDSTNQQCLLQSTPDRYFYKTYLQSNPYLESELKSFKSVVKQRFLNLTNTVRICSGSEYNFNMLGLFESSQTIAFSLYYTQKMSYFRVKMNVLSSQQNSKLTLMTTADGQVKTISEVINTPLDGFYYISQKDKQTNILYTPGLNSLSLGSIIRTYTFQVYVNAKQVTFELECLSSSVFPFWAVSDITVLAMQCNTCITTQLQAKLDEFGRFTLILAIITIPLLTLFIIYVQLKDFIFWKLKQKFFSKEQSKKQIPVKTIDRMINIINLQTEKEYQIKRRRQQNKLRSQRQDQKRQEQLKQTLQAIINQSKKLK